MFDICFLPLTFLVYFSYLKMVAIHFFWTFLNLYLTTRRHMPDDNIHTLLSERNQSIRKLSSYAVCRIHPSTLWGSHWTEALSSLWMENFSLHFPYIWIRGLQFLVTLRRHPIFHSASLHINIESKRGYFLCDSLPYESLSSESDITPQNRDLRDKSVDRVL
jgi:hypothetical protein